MEVIRQIGVSILLLFLAIQVTAQNTDLRGQWINELGSVLVIDSVSDQGHLLGMYHSSSGVDGQAFPLTGFANKKEEDRSYGLAFMVHWGSYGSITAWTGFADSDQEGRYLKMMWHLVRPGEEEPWERIITNSSTFRPFQRKP